MLDTIENTTRELPLDTAAKRALIESELRKDASRSDREIARLVGCDHKTVAARRREMGIATPLGNSNSPPTPTEHRQMLINGGEDFDAKYPPESTTETVDRMISEGKASYATAGRGGAGDDVASSKGRVVNVLSSPGACPPPPGVVDEPPEENPFLPESEDLVIPSQPAIAVYTNRYDQIVIRQEAAGYDDDDKFIYICPQHLDTLIVRLRKFLP